MRRPPHTEENEPQFSAGVFFDQNLREPPSSTPPQHRFQPVLQRFLQRSSQDLIRIHAFGEFLEGPLQSFNRGFLEWTLLIGGLGIGLNQHWIRVQHRCNR